MRHEKLLAADRTLLLLCDVQNDFLPHMDDIGRVIKRARIMIQASQILQIPIIVTEQYPKGLGRTVEPLQNALPENQTYFDKNTFSCMADKAIQQAILTTKRQQILIIGIETHICIAQTAHDILAEGLEVYLAADALGSRRPHDTQIALDRLRQIGAIVSTTEAAIMEMTGSSRHPNFKEISKIIK